MDSRSASDEELLHEVLALALLVEELWRIERL
jgi:hypothetical protein